MVKEQIETVLGAINADDLGITLPHEHVSMDCSYCVIPPRSDIEKAKFNEPITLSNLNWLRHNPYRNLANTKLGTEKHGVVEDLKLFKKSGGSTIVENTSLGINRDVGSMVDISKITGVHVVCGTGFFVEEAHSGEMRRDTHQTETKGKHPLLMDGHGESCANALMKCAEAAWDLGLKIFAVHNGGQCIGEQDGERKYMKHGMSHLCQGDGFGGPDSNEVYRFWGNNVVPRDGSYSAWQQWGGCSVNCGDGTVTRVRTCTEPAPYGGGKDCNHLGIGAESRKCTNPACP